MTTIHNFRNNDHFSTNSGNYSQYRPHYPEALFDYLATLTPQRQLAWDCATGTGQAAIALTRHFSQVIATDASEHQLKQATQAGNIHYSLAYAEQPPLKSNSIDLITVAQAFHWFNMPAFIICAEDLLRSGGILALWSYNLLRVSPQMDEIIHYLYHEILGSYWPAERVYVENGYSDIDFSLQDIKPDMIFNMEAEWSLTSLIGYLNTWSAVNRYREMHSTEPIDQIMADLETVWGHEQTKKHIHWPLQIRIGKKK